MILSKTIIPSALFCLRECQKDLDSPLLPSYALCLFVFWVCMSDCYESNLHQVAGWHRISVPMSPLSHCCTANCYISVCCIGEIKKNTPYTTSVLEVTSTEKYVFANSCLTNYFCLHYTSVQSGVFVQIVPSNSPLNRQHTLCLNSTYIGMAYRKGEKITPDNIQQTDYK